MACSYQLGRLPVAKLGKKKTETQKKRAKLLKRKRKKRKRKKENVSIKKIIAGWALGEPT